MEFQKIRFNKRMCYLTTCPCLTPEGVAYILQANSKLNLSEIKKIRRATSRQKGPHLVQTSIAIVADCDDTLAPDTTGQLLRICGVDSEDFFQNKSNPLAREGWDPSLAYMHEMIKLAQPGGPLAGLTRKKLTELAVQLEFYPGVPACFQVIKEEVENEPDFRAVGVRVESYVVSGGIADLLRASALKESVYRIWGCDFSYDSRDVIAYPKNVISFTDKTRFLFRINKGLTAPAFDNQPSSVNQAMTAAERTVPFENMIYLGDGPSDIPCMSLLTANKGFVIGVASPDNPNKIWALSHGRRANQTVDPDFASDGSAFRALREAVLNVAQEIASQNRGRRPVPQH